MPKLVLAVTLQVAVLASPCWAQDTPRTFDVHGFGGWAYGNTNHNVYLVGVPDGSYSQTAFDTNVVGIVSERLRIVGQVGFGETEEGAFADLVYGFAEWKVSDSMRLRVGQVKQPFGISGEVIAVGTLRPFFTLPQAFYGQAGLVNDAYKGVGLTGSRPLGRWRLAYDVYGGGLDLEQELLATEAFLRGATELPEGDRHQITKDVVGGRLVFETPVRGLRFGASAYTGKEIHAIFQEEDRKTVEAGQVEYLTGPWSLRSEIAHEKVADELTANAFYAEAAYHLTDHWQVAAQYSRLTSELGETERPVPPSLLDHEEFAVGLNYWFTPAFVLKLSYHDVEGNRFAGPDPQELAGVLAGGGLRTKTKLVLFGGQFSF